MKQTIFILMIMIIICIIRVVKNCKNIYTVKQLFITFFMFDLLFYFLFPDTEKKLF